MLLASMMLEGNRYESVLRTYINWRSISARLHEHLLVDGVKVTRERPVPMPLVSEVLKEHLVVNRPKGDSVSPTEFVISPKGAKFLRDRR